LKPYVDELVRISHRSFATALGVSAEMGDYLKQNEADNLHEMIMTIFEHWLRATEYPTWELLCKMLDENLCYRSVVQNIRKKYRIPDEDIRSVEELQPYASELEDHLYTFAVVLGVSEGMVQYIKKSPHNSSTKLKEIFRFWFERTHNPTWILLCEKLADSAIFSKVVRKIRDDHNI
jgi:hypothetical protein